MEKPSKVSQLYGYMVCLVAVVTSLFCINGLASNAVDLANPVAAANAMGESFDSFDG